MNKIKQYIKKKKYILLFLSVLVLIGMVVGLYLGISNIEILKEDVIYFASTTEHTYNYILLHFFLFTISLCTSFFGIGIPILCSIIFYEGLTMGFLMGIFTCTYALGGLIFSLFLIIITKGIYLLLLALYFMKCLEISRKMIGKYIYKTDPSAIVAHLLKACICLIVFLVCFDFLLSIIGNKIIQLVSFLLV